jgi:hypothetical protein
MFLPASDKASQLKHDALRRAMGFGKPVREPQKGTRHRRAQKGARRISRESRQIGNLL